MTVEELIDKLNKSTSDIEGLPSAPLSAPQGVRWAIADALKHAVRPSATVRDGLEIDRLRYESGAWQGSAEWLLIVDASLIHLLGVLVHDGKPTFQVQQRLVPLSTLRDPILTTMHQEYSQQVYLKSADLRVVLQDGEIRVSAELPDRKVDRILAFSRSLNSARG
jgi:hypothetical protein